MNLIGAKLSQHWLRIMKLMGQRKITKILSDTSRVLPRVGEGPMNFAENCCLLKLPNVAIGEMISIFNTNEHPLYFTYYFRTLTKDFARVAEGANVSNLYYSYLEANCD